MVRPLGAAHKVRTTNFAWRLNHLQTWPDARDLHWRMVIDTVPPNAIEARRQAPRWCRTLVILQCQTLVTPLQGSGWDGI